MQYRLYVYKDICLYLLYIENMNNFMNAYGLLSVSKKYSRLKGLNKFCNEEGRAKFNTSKCKKDTRLYGVAFGQN